MAYTTFAFACFMAMLLILYYCPIFRNHQWKLLLAGSLVFYAFSGIDFLVFILSASLVTYLGTLAIHGIQLQGEKERAALEGGKSAVKDGKRASKGGRVQALESGIRDESGRGLESGVVGRGSEGGADRASKRKEIKKMTQAHVKGALALCLLCLFGTLGVIKYGFFVTTSLNSAFEALKIGARLKPLYLVLPLGISFYTFQAAGYLIDVARGKAVPEKNFFRVLLFLSFFPQIVQGPISFFSDLSGQLFEKRPLAFRNIKFGSELVLWGLFKKLVIADRMLPVVQNVSSEIGSWSGTASLFALVFYAVQLYADFSAGIDISRGCAQMLGINLRDNFKRPYFSRTLGEYWRRWHITLGAWMKEYVFYPLAVSKGFLFLRKKLTLTAFGRTPMGKHFANAIPGCLATIAVFLLIGIWHGADWKYVVFGLYNGLVLALGTLTEPIWGWIAQKLPQGKKAVSWTLQLIRTWILILIGYVFDIVPSAAEGFKMIGRVITDQRPLYFISNEVMELFGRRVSDSQATLDYLVILISCGVLLIASLFQERLELNGKNIREYLDEKPFHLQWALLFIGSLFLMTYGMYGPSYDVQGFIYMNF